MRKQTLILVLLALISQFAMASWASDQATKPPVVKGAKQPNAKYGWLTQWAWTSEQWKGDDQPFIQIRAAVDRMFDRKKDIDVALQDYRRLAQQKPSDSQAQFRYGYLAYKIADTSDYNEGEKVLDSVRAGLADAPSPRTYNYSRLRFLTEAYMVPFPKLKGLGKRLLQQNPDDSDVKYYQATILGQSPNADEKRRAIAYARDLISGTSKHLSAYSLLGSIYYISWRRSHSKADADNGIAAYQQYLDLASPDHKFRSQASYFIHIMEKG